MASPPQTRAADTPVDWYTPDSIFSALGITFDLDPCAPPLPAATWIPAAYRISLPNDGLAVTWDFACMSLGTAVPVSHWRDHRDSMPSDGGPPRVWLNPPYGDQCGKWVGKLADHGRGIALVFARTDADWWQRCAARADAVTFLAQRVSFIPGHRSDRSTKGPNAAAPSCLIAYGEAEARACERSGLGLTFTGAQVITTTNQGALL